MMKYIKDDFIAAYYSQIGGYHLATGKNNQDKISCERVGDDRWYMALADGVSSADYAEEGARLAVESVRFMAEQLDKDAIWNLEKYKVDFVHLWKSKIADDWNRYASTLNFVIYVHGRVLIGQIGDGLIYSNIDFEEEVFGEDEDFFSTETSALATQVRKSEFTLVERSCKKELMVYMMSDGVGKEVSEESRRDLGDYLSNLLLKDEIDIEEELKTWISGLEKKNGDDKSVGFIRWRN